MAGGGVCGAIFRAAGYEPLQAACDAIGHCNAGSAVITPGFALNARYIIHAVGPVWHGGNRREPELLYGAYTKALELAKMHHCRSIGFPLISSGIYSYPVPLAWSVAITACADFLRRYGEDSLKIVFAVLSDEVLEEGEKTLQSVSIRREEE